VVLRQRLVDLRWLNKLIIHPERGLKSAKTVVSTFKVVE